MEGQTDYAIRERGGVPLKDYTKGGKFVPGKGLAQINFDLLGRALAIASLGLGLTAVLMPRRVQKMIGVKGKQTNLIRAVGARELSAAMLVGMQSRPVSGVASRVVGDVMDLSLLGWGFRNKRINRSRLRNANIFIAAITALDILTLVMLARKQSRVKRISDLTKADLDNRTRSGAFKVVRSITIESSPSELYSFWRNFENLPQFMYHLDMVSVLDDRRSHWVAKAPAGTRVEWQAEITQDQPNQLIAWRSIAGADVPNWGSVRFDGAPQGRGTVVRVEIEYRPPAGRLGKIVAKLFGEEPGQQVSDDLRRFKEIIETGEVLRSDGVPYGSGEKMNRPAQPMKEARAWSDDNKGFEKFAPEASRQRENASDRNTVRSTKGDY